MEYAHTQQGHWYLVFAAVSASCAVGAWLDRDEPIAIAICAGVGILMFLCALSFVHMTVWDDVDALTVRYGPFPLFSLFVARIPYDKITAIQPDRTGLLDGWGIHWFPGRGITYNIWGFDCVRIETDRRAYRIGTDDVANLVTFLRQRTQIMPSTLHGGA